MAISIFPSTAAEFVSNNFVVDMNDSTNNTADTGGVKQAGPYSMSFSSGDTSFDVYLIDDDGNSVGYSNNTSIVASGLFSTVVILGVAQDEVVSFLYQGSVNNADGEGDEPGAGAYLESISPSDLPSIDDTATVIGGNFGADVEITFESGATVLSAKNIVVNSSTELLVTRPDALIEDDSPYTLKAINPGVTPPTGTDAHILTDEVTAGSDPTWVTTSPLNAAEPGVAFSQTLEATDTEGTVVDYSVTAGSLAPGLSLNSASGVLSGTPTTGGLYVFTVTATDDGGNTTPKEFEHSVELATGGTVVDDGGFRYHTFTSSDDFEVLSEITDAEFILIGGGGGGGEQYAQNVGAGGGGAGGLLPVTTTLNAGTQTVTIGAGGAENGNGSDSIFGTLGTATGGGAGGEASGGGDNGNDGGSGGGPGNIGSASPGSANPDNIAGLLGFAGSNTFGFDQDGGGGGGAGEVGFEKQGGDGVDTYSAWATATGLVFDGGFFAAGGGGGGNGDNSPGGDGGGGNGASLDGNSTAGEANSGGGGGGGCVRTFSPPFNYPGRAGGSGVLIVRYAF